MTTSLEDLNAQILVAPHPDMEPHVRRGSFLLLEAGLDLAEVAQAMERNDEAFVAHLVAQKQLTKVGPDALEAWRRDKVFFRFLIVQPFVLAQVHVQLSNPTPTPSSEQN